MGGQLGGAAGPVAGQQAGAAAGGEVGVEAGAGVGSAWRAAHARSLSDPDGFWGAAARGIDWFTAPRRVLDPDAAPFSRWFTGGVLNVCYNALDRHVVAGRSDQLALVHESPVTGTTRSYSYARLLDQVARFAGALRALGVDQGDRVVLYLPTIPEAVIAMLACARIGAVHAVVPAGFGPAELATRIDDARPKVLVSASCGIEPSRVLPYKPMLDAALARAEHQPQACVIVQRPQLLAELGERDVDWATLVRDGAVPPAECVPVQATDPLSVLYTGAAAGPPKGIVRDCGGYAVALSWAMPNVYGMRPGEVWLTAGDLGSVVGHCAIVYAPLLAGCTTVLYEGEPAGTPDAAAFWRVVEQHRVSALCIAPAVVQAVRRQDPDGAQLAAHDLSSLRTLFLAGERLDPDAHGWAAHRLGVPVVDSWWQPETGWPICSNLVGLDPMPIKPGSASVPVPGYDVQVLGSDGAVLAPGQEGAICLRLPTPPGTLTTVWGDDERYVASYLSTFEGYHLTGASGYLDEDGYLFVIGRADD